MAFDVSTRIGDSIYRHHECNTLTHILGCCTQVWVRSYITVGGQWVDTAYEHELDDSLTFKQAEEWLQSLPEFAPYDDPVQAALDEVLPVLTDEQAETVIDAFPAWAAGIAYEVGKRVRYDGNLYKCVQAHTSQAEWTPDATPALWTRIGDPGEEWPEWVQPTGAQDAYAAGDKVSHADKHWTSDVGNNVWEPGVYGWTEVL